MERPSIGSLYRTCAGFGKKADSRFCDNLEGGIGLRDGHVHPLILDSRDHVPVLVVAEYSGSGALLMIEGLGGGMPVGVVRTDLDDGDLWGKVAQKEGGRGDVGAVVRHLENGQASGPSPPKAAKVVSSDRLARSSLPRDQPRS